MRSLGMGKRVFGKGGSRSKIKKTPYESSGDAPQGLRPRYIFDDRSSAACTVHSASYDPQDQFLLRSFAT